MSGWKEVPDHSSVRPELVEGPLFFFASPAGEGQGFDKLGLNGGEAFLNPSVTPLKAGMTEVGLPPPHA